MQRNLVLAGAGALAAIAGRALWRHARALELRDKVTGVARVLPGVGGIGVASARGADSESELAPSLLTAANDRAAIRNNEL